MTQEIAIKNLIFVDCEGHGPAPTLNDSVSFEFGAVAYPSKASFYGALENKEPAEEKEVFEKFDTWLAEVTNGEKPIFVSDNPINETNMARIWNRHKQIHPVRNGTFSNGAGTPLKRKVFVAMSGGVDSSVAAALLKGQGYKAIGVHMKFWNPAGGTKENRCCTLESEKRARQVAKILGIPFYVFNFEKEFKKRIVNYFLREERAGKTPNPCVVCNKEIKFGFLLEKALKLGAEYVATGHYARLRRGSLSPKFQIPIKSQAPIYKLLKGKDKNKDQSYFLWQLNQKQLKHILFPVGGYTKEEVRKLAKKFDLPTAKTPESMEICFAQTAVNDFLKKYLKIKPGDIVDTKGQTLGRHQGLWFYTIGQRKGIGLSGGPYYVLSKDTENNELVVTKKEKDIFRKELMAKDVNWIFGEEPKLPLKVSAKIRYRHEAAPAVIKKSGRGKIKIVFRKPQKAATSGQSVVFYNKKELIGGAVIQ